MIDRRVFLQGVGISFGPVPLFAASARTRLNLVVYLGFPPHSDRDAGGKWIGHWIDLTNRLLVGLEDRVTLEFAVDPAWQRALQSMENGDFSLLYEVSFRPERTKYLDYIGATDVERAYVVTSEDVALGSIDSLDQFFDLGVKVWFNRAVKWNPKFDKRLDEDPEFQALFVRNQGSATTEAEFQTGIARSIAAGRFDGYMMTDSTAFDTIERGKTYLAQNPEARKLKLIPVKAFGDTVTYFAASGKLPEDIRDTLKRNYAISREDGSFDEIWNRWFEPRLPPPDLKPGDLK